MKRKLIFVPFIYKMELQGDKIFMMLASASANYTKPELVTDTFFAWLGAELPDFAYTIKRLEVYADKGTEEEPQICYSGSIR